MRADRLITALLYLQGRPRVTAAELAAELEVSVGTARRDLEALSMAGIPVYPQPGRGGGWSLLGGARTDLSGLTASETQALFRLLGPSASATDELKSALRKLVRALPATFREDAEAASSATVIDPGKWGAIPLPRPALVDELQSAVVARQQVRLVYRGRTAEPSDRVVDPWGLVDKGGVWYLIAGSLKGRRTFRVDRIVSASVLEEHFERPTDFDLADAWSSISSELESRRSETVAEVVVPTDEVFVLREHFGIHCTVLSESRGRSRVQVAAPTPLDIARWLAGWGAGAEVLSPASVRSELARIGAELVARYAG
ncbi:helix-turn-helix transcriptional regulator [Pseudolysinimonas sp.]